MLDGQSSRKQEVRDNARGKARVVLRELFDHLGRPDYERFYPVDLEEYVEGVIKWRLDKLPYIGQTQYGDEFSGEPLIGKIDLAEKAITINESDPSSSYTLAHEIGHLILHRQSLSCGGGPVLRARSLRRLKFNQNSIVRRQEREANIFASELLMPEKAVRRQFKTIFNREKIRCESVFVSNLAATQDATGEQRRRRAYINQSDPLAVARFLSTYKPDPEVRSLSEFFGSSPTAMSHRLIELDLVF